MKKILSKSDFNTLVKLSKKILWSNPEYRREIQKHRINIIPANFYSNVPLIDDVHNSFEYKDEKAEVYNSNVFDKEKIESFIDQLCTYAVEFDPPMEGNKDAPEGYFWKNTAFSFSDAMSYYCMIRHFKPQHILEIGSGFSTLVADQALRKNGFGKVTLIEPFPMNFLKKLDSVDQIIESFVQDISVPDLVALVDSSDIWFIDSTHTVKVGSDCLYMYLKVMPEVSKDLIVHTHDVYLPFGFPKKRVLEQHLYWTEQYLLYAYMLDNPRIEVLFGSAHAHKILPQPLERLMGGKFPGGGGSLWYRLKPRSST